MNDERHFVMGWGATFPKLGKVFLIRLKKNDALDSHRHVNNFLFTPLADVTLEFQEENGESKLRSIPSKHVVWGWAGTEHRVKNQSGKSLDISVFELLFDKEENEEAPRYEVGSIKPDRAVELLYDQRGALVQRVTIAPGQALTWTPGSFYAALIFLDGGLMEIYSTPGSPRQRRVSAGETSVHPPSLGPMRMTNIGAKTMEILWVQRR